VTTTPPAASVAAAAGELVPVVARSTSTPPTGVPPQFEYRTSPSCDAPGGEGWAVGQTSVQRLLLSTSTTVGSNVGSLGATRSRIRCASNATTRDRSALLGSCSNENSDTPAVRSGHDGVYARRS